MKFVLFVEGESEAKVLPSFLKRWLDPQLEQQSKRPVGIQAVRFAGWSDSRKKLARKAQMHLGKPGNGEIAAALGLLDLYGPTFYPSGAITVDQRLTAGTRLFEDEINDRRFRMLFAVHELEAWILNQPELLPPPVRDALPGKVSRTESVNFDEPPSKLLDQLHNSKLGRGYKKLVYGKSLFAKLNPAVVREKCTHFASMFNTMLDLALRAQS